jgi:putative colanic acid biosynthesis UDP-glucose lipid carrier transferase
MRISSRLYFCLFMIFCDFSAFYVTVQLINLFQEAYPTSGLRFTDTHNKFINGTIWFSVATYLGVYQAYYSYSFDKMLRQTWRALLIHQGIVSLVLYFNTGRFYLEQVILVKIGLLFFFIFSLRLLFIRLELILENAVPQLDRVGIFGLNQSSIRLAKAFEMKYTGNKFAGIINESDVLRFGYDNVEPSDQILNAIHYAKEDKIRDLYVCFPTHLLTNLNHLFSEAEKSHISLHIVPTTTEMCPYENHWLADVGIRFFSNRKKILDALENRFLKRLFDIFFSSLVIILVLSWLYPIMAIIIKIQSPGPVLFKQKRTGRANKDFWCYKFRSMHVNANQDSKQAVKNDKRLTPIGSFIRKTSIDELPQFWNVLIGEMSVVGPRPHMLYHTDQYQQLAEGFSYRHFVKPGITGLAQVRGFRGEVTGVDVLKGRVEKDIEYIENWSIIQDFKICFLTVYFVFAGDEHAY